MRRELARMGWGGVSPLVGYFSEVTEEERKKTFGEIL
jgi:hypothetical protein